MSLQWRPRLASLGAAVFQKLDALGLLACMAPSRPGGPGGDQPTPDGVALGRAPDAWLAEAGLLPVVGLLHLDLLRQVTGRFQTALKVDSSSPACTRHSWGALTEMHVVELTELLVCTGCARCSKAATFV